MSNDQFPSRTRFKFQPTFAGRLRALWHGIAGRWVETYHVEMQNEVNRRLYQQQLDVVELVAVQDRETAQLKRMIADLAAELRLAHGRIEQLETTLAQKAESEAKAEAEARQAAEARVEAENPITNEMQEEGLAELPSVAAPPEARLVEQVRSDAPEEVVQKERSESDIEVDGPAQSGVITIDEAPHHDEPPASPAVDTAAEPIVDLGERQEQEDEQPRDET